MIKKTSIDDIKKLLKALGVKKNDSLFIHSSLFSLGNIENGVEGFHKAIVETIGPLGNIVVPTFSYSFRKNEIFDIKNTPSDNNIGVYSEYIRNLNFSIRSEDPLFSMSCLGPDAEKIMFRDKVNCFGLGSIYEKVFLNHFKFLCLGIKYSTGLTAFMHLERMSNVPYRYDYSFKGKTKKNNKIFEDEAIHFVKDQINYFNDSFIDREKIGFEMEETNVSKSINYRYGKHFLLEAENFQDYVLGKLKKDPLYMLNKHSI